MYSVEQMKPGTPIVPFFGGPLSQWKVSPFSETTTDDDGEEKTTTYINAEQYMMARKALLFGDREAYDSIMAFNNPRDSRQMKDMGRSVRNFDQQTWDEKKWGIVYDGNMLKFSQCPILRRLLLSFPRDCVFAECNPFDRVWGVGLRIGDERVFDYTRWNGKNFLGFVLTKVRDDILKARGAA